jgi:Spy/CpxP family protein refolding chaperone
MCTEGLRQAFAILIAGCGLGISAASAADSGAEPEVPDAGAKAAPEPAPDRPAARGPGAASESTNLSPQEWWPHAHEVLVEGLELSEEQTRQIDAVIERQLGAIQRSPELRSEIRIAREQADKKRTASLQSMLRANREEIKRPQERIEEMRAILREEQRPGFDMNRARLVAEGQEQQKKQGRRKPGAGAEVKAE